jgi:hypothetical protein
VRLRVRIGESVSSQRGFALIALLALAALISAFLIASTLNFTSAGNSQEREDRSMSALRQAKAALIAYAANEQWQLYKGQATDQPGALPCPDIVHDGTEAEEGDSDCVAAGFSSTSNLIGRIPWKTLGIDDLRDASGERLWYALAHNFRKLSGTTIINSDTQACDTPACDTPVLCPSQLAVIGTAPASNVVAIVFAPGQALDLGQVGGPLQNRPADHTDPAYNNPINYLENFDLNCNGDGRHYRFTTNAIPVDTFNDRLLVITQADLMAAVEPVVAARIERDIKPLLQDYFNKWGAYPFPVPFGGGPPTAQSSYLGDSAQTHGLLPLADAPTSFTWTGAAVTQLVGHPLQTGSPVVTSSSCTINSSPLQAVCRVDYDTGTGDRPVIVLEVFVGGNVSIRFADTPSGATPTDGLTIVDRNGNPLVSGVSPYGQWSFVAPFFPPTQTYVAKATRGALTYTGRLQPADATNNRVFITVPLPTPAVLNSLPIVSSNPGPGGANPNPSGAWFIANQWYKQTYYAVSAGYVPGAVAVGSSAACTTSATPRCLTVGNLPTPTNNKQAILVLAGRALNGSSRPSGIANYLEGANLTAANDITPFVYEHRAGAPTTINDRVVVVSP